MDDFVGSAALLAEVERREAELARLDEEFAAAKVTARSIDRTVAVTVDVRGHLCAVELTAAAYRAHRPDELGVLVTELAARASDSLTEHYRRRAEIGRMKS